MNKKIEYFCNEKEYLTNLKEIYLLLNNNKNKLRKMINLEKFIDSMNELSLCLFNALQNDFEGQEELAKLFIINDDNTVAFNYCYYSEPTENDYFGYFKTAILKKDFSMLLIITDNVVEKYAIENQIPIYNKIIIKKESYLSDEEHIKKVKTKLFSI